MLTSRIGLSAAVVLCLCLAHSSHAAFFFGTGASGGNLYRINPANGAVISVLPLSKSSNLALQFIPGEGLYGFNNADDVFFHINPDTAAVTPIAVLPYEFIHGFAYIASTDTLYGYDINTTALFTINRGDGATAFVGNTGIGFGGGLEYDSINGILYGYDFNGGLYTVNPANGASAFQGSVTGAGSVNASLGFNPVNGMLYASNDQNQFYRFDPSVRVAQVLSALPQRINGMTIPTPGTGIMLLGAVTLLRRRAASHL